MVDTFVDSYGIVMADVSIFDRRKKGLQLMGGPMGERDSSTLTDNRSTTKWITVLLSNGIAAFGVIYLGWSILLIAAYYVVELMLVGLVNIVKIHLAWKHRSDGERISKPRKFISEHAQSYAMGCLFYLLSIGMVVAIAWAEKESGDVMIPDIGKLADHPFIAIDGDLSTILPVLGAALMLTLLKEVSEFVVGKPYRDRTAREQADTTSGQMVIPMVAGMMAFFVFLLTHSPTLTVVAMVGSKAVLELTSKTGEASVKSVV